MFVAPVRLEGTRVRLERMRLDHVDALAAVGLDESLWRFTPRRLHNRNDMSEYVGRALDGFRAGTMLPFVIIDAAAGAVIGSTRFGNIDRDNRRVEIGWTWITPAWQRTGANREAKYLLLEYAFEELDCIRVEFKTDALNKISREALRGLGAVEEGTLRNHVVVEGGRLRDTVYYSILDSEWPAVKSDLERGLGLTTR